MYKGLDPEVAAAIYDVLVAEAGAQADEDSGMDFVFHNVRDNDFTTEYRFCGSLGFGGKFYRSRSLVSINTPESERDLTEYWYVSCYPESETPERRATIERTNAALAALNIQVGPRR